jgi:type III pantothenate kinase
MPASLEGRLVEKGQRRLKAPTGESRLVLVLLAVDIGNTNITCGVYRDRDLAQTFRAETARSRTADEYAVLLRQMLALSELGAASITAAIIASVVPPLTDVLARAIRQGFARDPLIVGPGLKTGIAVKYETPHAVGADRIVNAVAAFERYRSGVIVVDFGTATTFDCISAKAEYLGGVIVPGIRVSLDGLVNRAAKLSPIEIAAPPRVLGRNTTHSLQSGIVFGYASLVDGLGRKLEAELAFACKVIGTGGLATLIAEHSEALDELDENLTLEGLRILHERNSSS